MNHDDETRPLNAYERKQEARRQRYEARAGNAEAKSAAASRDADRLLSVIPPGQPILIGHHSEKGHRRHLARVDTRMRAAVEGQKTAEYYAQKAASVGLGGISSDDPDAIEKLRREHAELVEDQERMKKVNRAIRKNGQAGVEALGYSAEEAAQIVAPDFCGRVGFPSYALSNNRANIRRIEKRIRDLEAARDREEVTIEGDGYTYREDVEDNRVTFTFDAKPDAETRKVLKSYGFKWSPSREGQPWVRKLTGNALAAGRAVRVTLDADE